MFCCQPKSLLQLAGVAIATSSLGFAAVPAQAASFSATMYAPNQQIIPLTLTAASDPNVPSATTYSFSGSFPTDSTISFRGTFYVASGTFTRYNASSDTFGSSRQAHMVKLGAFSITNQTPQGVLNDTVKYVNTSNVPTPFLSWASVPTPFFTGTQMYALLTGEATKVTSLTQFDSRLQANANVRYPLTGITTTNITGALNSNSNNNTLTPKSSTSNSYTFNPANVLWVNNAGVSSTGTNALTFPAAELRSLGASLNGITLFPNSTLSLLNSATVLFTEGEEGDTLSPDEVEDLVNVFSGIPIDDARNFNRNFRVFAPDATQVSPRDVPEPSSFFGLVAIAGLLLSAKKHCKNGSETDSLHSLPMDSTDA